MGEPERTQSDVSVCMVTLDCWVVLEPCLKSLEQSNPELTLEIIVVDNGSVDGTARFLKSRFPRVRVTQTGQNLGFTRGTNLALRQARGRFLLWLNADTILRPDSISKLVEFLDAHPTAGIVGPMVLNADGSFQPQCRRGIPTPLASLAYLLKVDRIFPRSERLGQYVQRFKPINEDCEVDAVSGCCLLTRREVWNQIGALDADIFGFGEDIDWCFRATQAGWKVWYTPRSVIVHLKGQSGTHSKPYHKVWGMHQAMWVFFRKHLEKNYSPPVVWLVRMGIALSLTASVIAAWARGLAGKAWGLHSQIAA